jgi:UDP-N-acetylmuramyl pentapeptide phosphotransferase/UDP-N-acetylglucosamine-1-phosphate transferase
MAPQSGDLVPALALLLAPLLAGTVSALLTGALSRHSIPWLRVLDHPNARSLHQSPVPRSGGVAVLAGLAVGITAAAGVLGDSPLAWVWAAVTLVAGVSLLDDLGHVHPLYRLLAQSGAALLLILGGLQWRILDLPALAIGLVGWLSVVLTLLYVVWMINLYNFMDGMDGFAAGMALIGFGALAVLGVNAGAWDFALAALLIAAAAAGFLTRNFPPARIFLGDVGSSVLGLLAAAMTLWGAALGLFPLWVGWLLFSPFIVDATWTLLRRALNGEPVWRPHRSHHYQRLVLLGWGHRRTLLWGYLLMMAAAASAVAAVDMAAREQWLLLLGWAVIYLLIHLRVRLLGRAAPRAGS